MIIIIRFYKLSYFCKLRIITSFNLFLTAVTKITDTSSQLPLLIELGILLSLFGSMLTINCLDPASSHCLALEVHQLVYLYNLVNQTVGNVLDFGLLQKSYLTFDFDHFCVLTFDFMFDCGQHRSASYATFHAVIQLSTHSLQFLTVINMYNNSLNRKQFR